MAVTILIGLIISVAAVLWVITLTLLGRVARRVRIIYSGCFILAGIAAYLTTYHYIYHPSENTRLRGWPVPWLVEERDSAASEWVDFIGPLIVLAYPLNLVLYLLLPSVLVIVRILVGRMRLSKPQTELDPVGKMRTWNRKEKP